MSMDRRIGYVLKMYPRFSETFVVNEILALERQGLNLDIFSLRPPNDSHFHETLSEVRAGVTFVANQPVKSIDLWSDWHEAASMLPELWPTIATAGDYDVRDVHQAVLLACRVKRSGLEHLHAHFADIATNVAHLAARMTGISYSFTAHAKDIFHQDVNSDRLRQQIQDAAYVITISDYNHRLLSELCPEAATKIHRIYNGLDLIKYPYSNQPGRSPEVVAVGRLVEKKGFDILINACRILRDEGMRIPCRIIGSGAQKAALQQQIEALALQDLVRLEGPMTHGRIIETVSAARLFAAPCIVGSDGNRDGLPTVLLEAMALGTPCISTDVTGIPELLDDGETGLCVPQRDAGALAQAILRLHQDSQLAHRLAINARARIEKDFDNQKTSLQIAQLHCRQTRHTSESERS